MKKGEFVRIPNGVNGEIRITLKEFKGVDYVDIRKYYFDPPQDSSSKEDAERPAEFFKPTKKGISLDINQFKEAMKTLVPVLEELEVEG